MGERQFAPLVYTALKSRWRTYIKANFGVQKVAAESTRVGQQALSDYGNANADEFVPIDVVLDLARESGNFDYLRFAADQVDHLLLPIPPAARDGSALGRVAGEAMKETADVFQRFGQMLSDGVLSSAEGPYLRKEIREAILKLVMFDLQVEEEMKRPAPEGRT